MQLNLQCTYIQAISLELNKGPQGWKSPTVEVQETVGKLGTSRAGRKGTHEPLAIPCYPNMDPNPHPRNP